MQRRLKILHVLHAFSHGGLENGTVNIINGSPEHIDHELCFLDCGGEFLQRLRRRVTYHELKKRPGNDIRLVLRLREIFRQSNADIIHTRNWAAFDGVLAACLTPRAVLIHSEHGHGIAGEKTHRNIARRALAFRTRKVVTVSHDLYEWLRFTVRIPSHKIEFIPNGVDTEHFRPGRDTALRRDLGISDDECVVGVLGRLDPIKNLPGVISAVGSLTAMGQKVRLVIVGEGPERCKIEGLLRSHLASAPLLLGARTDVARLYRAFDVFVLNSFHEGMSNALLEAMASGLGIVCTAVGGNVELVADKRRGLLVPPDDNRALAAAISGYINSPRTRTDYGGSARRFVEDHFSLDAMIRRYIGLYESVA